MFIAQLTPMQQGILLQLGTELVSADGVVHDKEKVLLATFRSQMSPGVEPVSADQLSKEFFTQSSKVALLLELLGLAHADADYDISERDFISSVADRLDISVETLSDMNNWVLRQFALVREAVQLMEV